MAGRHSNNGEVGGQNPEVAGPEVDLIAFLPHPGSRELEEEVLPTLTSGKELLSAKRSTSSRFHNHPKECHQPGTKCPKGGALYGDFTFKPTQFPRFSKTRLLPPFWHWHLVGAFLLADERVNDSLESASFKQACLLYKGGKRIDDASEVRTWGKMT